MIFVVVIAVVCHIAFICVHLRFHGLLAHHIGAIGPEVAGEAARHAMLVEFVERARGDGDDASGEALGAVGECFARGHFVGEREGEMEWAIFFIALGAIDLDASGEAADFGNADFDARGSIYEAARVAPGWSLIQGG